MSLFRSDRERRLWLSALAVTAAIYATLGLAGTLVGVLRAEGLLAPAFALGLVAVVVAVVGSAVRRKPSGPELWVWAGVLAVYGMVLVRMGVSIEERTHIFEYGLLAVLIHQALRERSRNGGRVRYAALLSVVITGMLGWADEGIQQQLPSRTYDVRDVGFNVLAGIMAVSATSALNWVRSGRGRDGSE